MNAAIETGGRAILGGYETVTVGDSENSLLDVSSKIARMALHDCEGERTRLAINVAIAMAEYAHYDTKVASR